MPAICGSSSGAGFGIPAVCRTHSGRVSHEQIGFTILWKEALAAAAILASQWGNNTLSLAGVIALTLWAIRDVDGAIQSLSLLMLAVFANNQIGEEHTSILTARWGLLFIAWVRIYQGWSVRRIPMPLWAFPFAVFVLAAAAFTLSNVAPVRNTSLLKLCTFSMGVTAPLFAFSASRKSSGYWWNWWFTIYCVVIVGSVPLMFVPQGYKAESRLFMGVLWHSQTFGVYLAPLTAVLGLRLATGMPLSRLGKGAAILGCAELLLSGCRTALCAMALGLAGLAACALWLRPELRRTFLRDRVMACVAAIIFGGVALLAWPGSGASDYFMRFLAKSDLLGDLGLTDVRESLEASRWDQIQNTIDVIKDNPLMGVGFGLSTKEEVSEGVTKDELFGLTVSAPTEMGFLPLALTAQLGVIGLVPIVIFLAVLLHPIVKRGSPEEILILGTALSVNIGEMIFTATGGLGLQMWLLVGFCYALSEMRRRPCGSSSGKTS